MAKSFWETLIDKGLELLNNNKPQIIEQVTSQAVTQLETPVKPVEVHIDAAPAIDWTNPVSPVSKHFTVHEMIYLPTWKRMANEADGLNESVKAELIDLAKSMDIVREYFGKSINVHVTYRPMEYNKAIGGALHSAHSDGGAMDFDVAGIDCDAVRKQINDEGMLDKWQMRMEDISALASRNWIHLDRRQPPAGGHRYFKP